MDIIREKLKLLPDSPGVYIMLDSYGGVIYVGKAKNLKNRVRQYFMSGVKTEKVMALVSNIADFNYIITKTEIDALSLENNLIKKHKPKYNILLKDDKTYPYLKINLKDLYPTFTITRKIKKDGCKYFGPFMGGVSVKDVLEIINFAFMIRPCSVKIVEGKPRKACLNYHIKRCAAACTGEVKREDYMKNVKDAIDFLNGDESKVEKLLKEKMEKFAEAEEFEQAISYRDKLNGLSKIRLKRVTAINKFLDADIIAFESNGIHSAINILITRKGRMVGGKNFAFFDASFTKEEAVAEFILRYYKDGVEIPEEIIVEQEIGGSDVLEEYLKGIKGTKVNIVSPKMGIRRQLIEMAQNNAQEYLEISIDKIKHKSDMTTSACQRLQEILGLSRYPKRMECYDISNISGVDKVGSMVVFDEGEPDKQSYRRFRIKTVEGANDFASLQEMLKRRLNKLNSEDKEKFPKPDLIIIDGGKGQLSAVKEVFDSLNVKDIDLISLAERDEEIFTLKSNQPIVLKKSDYVLRMLQRIRDEAHRFAITYHRALRGKRTLSSILEDIDGIGKVRRLALLKSFKDIESVMKADKKRLMEVEGIGEKQAELIIKYFENEGKTE